MFVLRRGLPCQRWKGPSFCTPADAARGGRDLDALARVEAILGRDETEGYVKSFVARIHKGALDH